MPASTRTELGAFLRAARAQLGPAELGLTGSGRRRTPGLRREEVAAASGVGVSWYSWLEQGRVNASRAVLDAIAGTLRLTAEEHAHLLVLGGFAADPVSSAAAETVALLASWPDTPALALDHRFDVLAANGAAASVWPGVRAGGNLLLALADAPGWEEALYALLLRFRVLADRYPDDDGVRRVLAELPRARPDLAHFWQCRALRRSGWSLAVPGAPDRRFRCTLVRPYQDDLHTVLLAVPENR